MNPVGRPFVARPIHIRLREDMLLEVDKFAAVEGLSRSEAIRELVGRGLRRKGNA